MATTLKTADIVQEASKMTEVPSGAYTVQINKVDQTSNKNKACPQDKFVCEILAPDVVESEGRKVQTAGRPFEFYLTYSLKNLSNCKEALTKLGIQLPDELTIPDEGEVRSGALTTIPQIQGITSQLVGGQFVLKLKSTRLTEKVKEGDAGYLPGKPVYAQPNKLDANGQVIWTDMYQVELPGREDIQSPINNIRFDTGGM